MNTAAVLKKSVEMVKAGHKPKVTLPCDMPEGTVRKADGSIRLPKSPAACVDLLYKTREQRLQLQRQLDRMEDLEKALKKYFVENLPKDSTGLAGRVARVQIEVKPIPVVEDWQKVYAYVKKTGAWELLQRRLNEGAIKERWEDHKEVPGVGVFNVKRVSCVKIN